MTSTTSGQILDLSSGWRTTCASVSGQLQCFGWNQYGQMGIGPFDDQYSPMVVNGPLGTVTTIKSHPSAVHTCALTSEKELWCWGSNTSSNIGLGNSMDSSFVPVNLSTSTDFLPQNVKEVQQIALGRAHTCIIALLNDNNKRFWCWGANEYGMLGINSMEPSEDPVDVVNLSASDVVTIESGYLHTCAVVSDSSTNSLWCWGLNESGQLGIGTDDFDSHVPQQVQLEGGGNVVSVSSLYYHTCAVVDQDCYCWGNNMNGQLGIGSTTNQNAPKIVSTSGPVQSVVAGGTHTCAILQNGGLE